MRRTDVLKVLIQHQGELRGKYDVKSLALFGSVARDEASSTSDVDLLVEFDRPVGLLHFVGTHQYIERLLKADKVDLVLRRAVLPELRDEILAEAVDVF
jgi:predicted nucleotidyltransferase